MEEFNKLLQAWRKELRKQEFLEDGVIAELEDHLFNEIESLEREGHSKVEAFRIAKNKIGTLTEIANNERISNSRIESNFSALLRNILKVTTRYFRKNRLTSSINMGGLVIAFVSLFFISFFIYDELSFEKHHPDYEQIHRLSYSWQMENGTIEERAFSSGMWVDLLKERFAGVEETFRFVNISYGYIQNPSNNESFYTEGVYWSDPNFFEFLNFKLKYGREEDQLKDLNSITLTEKTAQQIFGKENPIGESLKFVRTGNEVNLVVTGVIYDPPSNSQFQPDYIGNLQSIQGIFGEENRGWVDKNPRPGYMYSYVKAKPEQLASISNELKAVWKEVIPERAQFMEPLLTPISEIHFNPPMRWEIDVPIDMNVIYGLMIIGIFILLIALTNYTNLVTAQASKRQKEIGLRKTLGSTRKQIMIQFFIESIGVVLIAFLTSSILVYLMVPKFNSVLDKNIDFVAIISSVDYIFTALLVVLLILIYAGLLPAFYFTKHVKNSFNVSEFFVPEKVNSPSRNILVIIQFTVAIILVISTITVYNQLDLINNSSLGKSRNAVLGVRTSRMGNVQQAQLLKQRLEPIIGVEANTLGMHLPRQSDFGRIDTKFLASSGEALFWNKFDADGGFLTTYDIELITGRDFNRNIEPNALIVNESAVAALNLTPQEALGTYLKEDSINYVFGGSDGIIVGVVKDFAYKSIKEEIEPLVICANNEVEGVLSIKLGQGNKLTMIAQIKEVWDSIYPNRPFEYWFLDKEFDRMYSQERRLGRLIPFFSVLAIVIAMLGLFALTIFISELRKKEIGIRKVLGCSSSGIVRLLGWQFLKTIIPAILIGVPIAYFGLSSWLESFRYRVDISFETIALSVIGVILFAIITISFKAINAATRNPVENLKYE